MFLISEDTRVSGSKENRRLGVVLSHIGHDQLPMTFSRFSCTLFQQIKWTTQSINSHNTIDSTVRIRVSYEYLKYWSYHENSYHLHATSSHNQNGYLSWDSWQTNDDPSDAETINHDRQTKRKMVSRFSVRCEMMPLSMTFGGLASSTRLNKYYIDMELQQHHSC